MPSGAGVECRNTRYACRVQLDRPVPSIAWADRLRGMLAPDIGSRFRPLLQVKFQPSLALFPFQGADSECV
jgi:hypothetical protein